MDEKKKVKRPGRLLLSSMLVLGISILLQVLARRVPNFGQWYAVTIYPILVAVCGRVIGWLPFSVVEFLIYFLIIFCVVSVIRLWRQPRRLLTGGLSLLSIMFLLYTLGCGINYYRQPFSAYTDFRSGNKYTIEELEALCLWLTEQVNASYVEPGQLSQAEYHREGINAMVRLGEKYPQLGGFYPRPKPILFSRLLTVQGVGGIYSPFTIEANYNQEIPAYNIPHTICHELSHLKGFMREDEANFISFLACIDSDSPAYQSSGYMVGWVYAGNALAVADRDTYLACRARLRPEAEAAFRQNTLFWNQYDTPILQAAETVNNTYLRANNQPEGVKSYGRVVDLMLNWYLSSR